jgi:hypothetical protein
MASNTAIVARLLERQRDLEAAKAEIDEELGMIREMLSGPQVQDIIQRLEAARKEEAGSVSSQAPTEDREYHNLSADDVKAILPLLDVSGMPVWKAAVEILQGVGEPLSLDTLTQVINDMGKRFGGERPQKALSAHISQKSELLSQENGVVSLVEWRK